MNDDWIEEREEIRATLRRFATEQLEPWVPQIEETGNIPPEVIRLFADSGYLGITLDPQYGGAGAGLSMLCLVMEEFSRSHRAFALLAGASSGITASSIVRHGTAEQRDKYLPGLSSGRLMTAFALSEPDAGSDNSAMKTNARKVDGGWVINGRKHFISGGENADFLMLMAITDKEKKSKGGVSAFLVDKGTPGFEVTRVEQTMASNFIKLAELTFEDCFVPDSALLGKEGTGFAMAMESLSHGRLALASSCIGAADRLLEMGVSYSQVRTTFGKPLAARQAIQWMLADSATELAAGRALTYDTIRQVEGGARSPSGPSMCKLFCSEMVNRVADRVVQVHGGMGLVRGYPVERFYRDVRYFRVGEGTSEIQRILIARHLVGRSDG